MCIQLIFTKEGVPMTLSVPLPAGSYDIIISTGILNRISEYANLDRRVLVVTDDGVPSVYAETVAAQCKAATVVTLPQGEQSKTLANFEKLLTVMLDNGFTRTDCAVAVGGGVVTDITGFAAASYMRGIDFYNVPTTLLAQTDASVGGKTAVDLNGVKNIVGAFHQPKGVFIDTDTLKTLDSRQYNAGMAEIIKTALCFDADFFDGIKNGTLSTEELISRSVQIKADVVTADEKEAGLRRVLNFGHTVGHAVETLSGLLHGESVAIGMTYMCSPEVRKELCTVLEKYSLPTRTDISPERLFSVLIHDKKADGDKINIVVVNKIGSFEIKCVSFEEMGKKLRNNAECRMHNA